MSVHVAIVVSPYDRLILEGRKTVEARLTRTAQPPFGRIVPGERIYLKRSGGAFFAVATVDRVWMTDRLTPQEIDRLRRQFDSRIHGTPDYWQTRRDCRFATLIWLREVSPSTLRPAYTPQNMRAWYTLPDEADPIVEPLAASRAPARSNPREAASGPRRKDSFLVTLTAGSLRQSQLRIAAVIDRFPARVIGGARRADAAAKRLTLHLAHGPAVETDIVGERKMLRWRGWAPWFTQHGLAPGDQVRFTPRGDLAFDVEPARS